MKYFQISLKVQNLSRFLKIFNNEFEYVKENIEISMNW